MDGYSFSSRPSKPGVVGSNPAGHAGFPSGVPPEAGSEKLNSSPDSPRRIPEPSLSEQSNACSALAAAMALPALGRAELPARFTHIYFLRASNGLVKAGFSGNLRGRVSALMVGSPIPLAIIGFTDGSRRIEQIIHLALDESRSHGEWFRPSPLFLSLLQASRGGGWRRFVKTYHWAHRWDFKHAVADLLLMLERSERVRRRRSASSIPALATGAA